MRVLGITSAAHNIGVAFTDGGKVVAEYSIAGKEVHSEDLVKLIDRISQDSKIKISDLDGIAVVKGPGSYGGIRGGVTTAKTIAQVHALPIVGISTLDAIAFSNRNIAGTLLVLLNACRNDYNAALFACRAGVIERLT
ncbi:MAG: tRNA (adenosine(37)-N6)-threonylcarbamoyltransferase complex dimerization subunit type 1 TsaB, partial [bacterium]